MIECTYCKRILKRKYSTCPGCGASSFKEIEYKHDLVIDKPPKDGYKIEYYNFKRERLFYEIFFWTGILALIVFFISEIPALFKNNILETLFYFIFLSGDIFLMLIVSIPFILFGRSGIKRINKRIDKLKILSTKGILVKNLKYEIVPTQTIANNKKVYVIKVEYTNKKGVKIPLFSEEKYDGKLSREDGTVDLLIDPKDVTNYYINFEIY